MKPRRKIHEIDETNDIKYRGPLSYQHFRMIAWLLLAFAQIGVLMTVADQISGTVGSGGVLQVILTSARDVATPLLLIANFSVILTAHEKYKQLLVKFGALSAACVALFMLFYERYFLGLISIGTTREAARATATELIGKDGFFDFNIFLDLLLCTLVMFFLNYTPKKRFEGKKLILFRLFALLPILYETASVILKMLVVLGKASLPPWTFPFLTTKPPLEFVVFIALALFIKRRERKFKKNGKTAEEYRAFLDTKANSWHFSVHSAVIMAVAAIVDFLIAVVIGVIIAGPAIGTEAFNETAVAAVYLAVSMGFGASIPLIFVAPVMLLFSYNRTPKRPKLDLLIPIIGVVLIVFVYIEGAYQLIISLK